MANYGLIFDRGFDRGAKMGAELEEAQRRAAARKELQGLSQEAQATQETTDRYNAYNENIAAQDAATFGDTGLTATDYQYGTAPAPMAQSQRMARSADIYSRHGFDDKAEQYSMGAYDAAAREKTQAQADEERGYRMKGLERGERQAVASEQFNSQFNEYMSSGKPFNPVEVRQMAAKAGVDQNTVNQALLTHFGVTEKEADHRRKTELDKFNELTAKGGLLGLIEGYDPDPTDEARPELKKMPDGSQVVMYNGQIISPPLPADNMKAGQVMVAHIKSTWEGDPLGTASKLLDMDYKRSQMRLMQSQIELNGRLPRDANGGNGGMPPLSPQEQADLNALADQYEKALQSGDRNKARDIAQIIAVKRDVQNVRRGMQSQLFAQDKPVDPRMMALYLERKDAAMADATKLFPNSPRDQEDWASRKAAAETGIAPGGSAGRQLVLPSQEEEEAAGAPTTAQLRDSAAQGLGGYFGRPAPAPAPAASYAPPALTGSNTAMGGFNPAPFDPYRGLR